MNDNRSSISKIESLPDIVDDIRILVVDDQHFARTFLEKVLDERPRAAEKRLSSNGDKGTREFDKNSDRESQLKVIGTANNGLQALQQVEFLQPDVVVIDLEMPEMDGITATKIITQKFPGCKVLVLSSYDNTDYLHHAFQAGAKGYLLKSTPGKELRNAILFVNKGYAQIGPGLLEKTFNSEIEVAARIESKIAQGPREFGITEATEPELPSTERWSSSTQEILNTFPRVWSRGLVYLLLVFIAVGIPWTILAQIDETGTARGKIEPKGKTLRLDATVSGKVTEVKVEEGQLVREGQDLLIVESAAVQSELKQQKEKLAGLQNQLAKLDLLKKQHLQSFEAQNQQNGAQTVEKQAQLAQAEQNLKSLKSTYNSHKQEKQAQIEQTRKAIATSQAAYELAQIRLKSAAEKVPRYRKAFQDGAISQDRLLETTQLAQEARKELKRAKSELEQVKLSLKETQSSYQTIQQEESAENEQAKLRLLEQQGSYNSLVQTNNLALLQNQAQLKDTEANIATLQGEIAQTKSQVKSLEFQLTQYRIKAPSSGTIFQFPIQNAGATVQSGDTIAEIAQFNNSLYPSLDSDLVLRAKMPSSETASLKTGLPAKIKLDAYPFQDYGIVKGHVSWISPDSKTAQEGQPTPSAEQGEFFELEISLDQKQIGSEANKITIIPGQTATAEVIVRQRRLIDFFLEPFQKMRQGGLEL